MLPQQGLATGGYIGHVSPGPPIQLKKDECCRQRAQGKDSDNGSGSGTPKEEWQAVDGHAWCPQTHDGGDEVDRPRRGRDGEKDQRKSKEIHARIGQISTAGQRRKSEIGRASCRERV